MSILKDDINKLPQEIEEGNIEYKRTLCKTGKEKFNNLVSQLKWRLGEGDGTAIYIIGVDDDGTFYGLNIKHYKYTLKILCAMAKKTDSTATVKKKIMYNSKYIAEVEIKRNISMRELEEVRVVFIGNTDVGKSTLISILVNGSYDNGSGNTRINMFNHKHEIESGKTSSISSDIIGFKNNVMINFETNINMTWEMICNESDKIISLIDLPGFVKYTKTTLYGLMSYYPDYICFVIAIDEKIDYIRNNLKLCLDMEKPMLIVITKTDLDDGNNRMDEIIDMLENEVTRDINVIEEEHDLEYEDFFTNIQVFTISNVNRTNVDLLTSYLGLIREKKTNREKLPTEFIINKIFCVPDVGTVISGVLTSGIIKLGDDLLLGCFKSNIENELEKEFNNLALYDDDIMEDNINVIDEELSKHNRTLWKKVIIKSIHRKQVPYKFIRAGNSASIVITEVDHKLINKHMVLISPELRFNIVQDFKIKIVDEKYIEKLEKGQQLTVNFRNSLNQIFILDIENDVLSVRLIYEPRYIKNMSYVILRDNGYKFVGQIIKTKNFYL